MRHEVYGEVLVSTQKFTELFNEYCQLHGVTDVFLEQGIGNAGYGYAEDRQPQQSPRMILRFGTRYGVKMGIISRDIKPKGLMDTAYILIQGEGDFYPISVLVNDNTRMHYEFTGSDPKLPDTEFTRATLFAKDFQVFALKKIFGLI